MASNEAASAEEAKSPLFMLNMHYLACKKNLLLAQREFDKVRKEKKAAEREMRDGK